MQKDGLAPIAFADKDGWPAMGTFDQLNLRINGYQFHVDLMAGKEAWDSAKVKKVFDTWKRLLPVPPGRRARPHLAGGGAVAAAEEVGHVPAGHVRRPAVHRGRGPGRPRLLRVPGDRPGDRHGRDRGPDRRLHDAAEPKNEEGAKKLLEYLGTAEAEDIYLKADPTVIAASSEADTAGYTGAAEEGGRVRRPAKQIAQFLDRDTRPDFASTVMIPALQTFLKKPNDIDGLTKSIESQKKSIFTS